MVRPEANKFNSKFSYDNYGDNQLNPEVDVAAQKEMRNYLRIERDQVHDNLTKLKQQYPTLQVRKEMRECKRRLWLIDGYVILRLNLKLLESILKVYEKIDAVPTHYHQPELYMKKPRQ